MAWLCMIVDRCRALVLTKTMSTVSVTAACSVSCAAVDKRAIFVSLPDAFLVSTRLFSSSEILIVKVFS